LDGSVEISEGDQAKIEGFLGPLKLTPEKKAKIIGKAKRRAIGLITEHWQNVCKLAAQLHERKELAGRQIELLLGDRPERE
jgi:ATP-dependent Zn protease